MKRIISAIPVFLLWACAGEPVGDALREMRSEKYAQRIQTGTHVIQVHYLPRALQLLRHGGIDSTAILSAAMLDSLERIFGPAGMAFLLRVEPKSGDTSQGLSEDIIFGNRSGFATFQEAQKAYQFGLKEKIWLESGVESIPLVQYTMENTFGMDPGRNFLLLFGALPQQWRGTSVKIKLVLDDIVPGMTRQKLQWTLPVGKYDKSS